LKVIGKLTNFFSRVIFLVNKYLWGKSLSEETASPILHEEILPLEVIKNASKTCYLSQSGERVVMNILLSWGGYCSGEAIVFQRNIGNAAKRHILENMVNVSGEKAAIISAVGIINAAMST
jgi:hypothetical protein